jgi:hypothetical protein
MVGLPIIIPTRTLGQPAALALTMEGHEVTEVAMRDYCHYGRMLTQQWQTGRGFILVEEDIVPWPGALAELERCEQECCAFEYPTGIIIEEPRSGWCVSLGCIKFATSLVARVECGYEWQNAGWDSLEGKVFETLQGEVDVHVHGPPVAHVRASVMLSHRVEMPR